MLAHVVVEGLLAVLQVQLEVLDGLLHRLVGARALLTVGDVAHLGRSAADVDAAAAAVRDHEPHRIQVAEATATVLRLPPAATLRRLALAAPEPLATPLHDDAAALRAVLDEVDGAAADVRLATEIGLSRCLAAAPRHDHERWRRERELLGQRALRLAADDLPLPRLRAFCS